MARIIFLLAVAASVCSCKVRFRDDDRTAVYHVPNLTAAECSRELLTILTRTSGVLEASPDLANQTVTVKFNSRITAIINIEHAIAEGGFDVNQTPADPAARDKLPESCR